VTQGTSDTAIDVCAADELGDGQVRIVEADGMKIGVFNCGGELFAIEDRCSHDDGPLCEGDFDQETGVAICPRHGANFDIRSGRPLTLPAYEPVETFPVRVDDGMVKVTVT
jgi:3-phenylpropionate/trans-cinnamate dioxygenase ferredoxin subunit